MRLAEVHVLFLAYCLVESLIRPGGLLIAGSIHGMHHSGVALIRVVVGLRHAGRRWGIFGLWHGLLAVCKIVAATCVVAIVPRRLDLP